jgi:hypothetical protein
MNLAYPIPIQWGLDLFYIDYACSNTEIQEGNGI